jgi:bacteriocin biosynthesis cyclodehydratase domain-containing protein
MTACHAMTRLHRPVLLPGLARLWRDRHTLQLGLDPARAVLVEVADPAVVRLLDLLDGAHTEREVLAQAARLRITVDVVRNLVDILHHAGLVVPAHTLLPTTLPEPMRQRLSAEAAGLALRGSDVPATPAQVLRRRAASRVLLSGRCRLAVPVALALAQAGVGHVSPELCGRVEASDTAGGGLTVADLRRPRAEAVVAAIGRTAPGTETGPIRRGSASIVVQAGIDRPAPLLAEGFAQRRQAHLVLDIRDGTAVVGPLVRPGGDPCLNCLDLHRRDRDPDWPGLAAQLAGDARPADACATPTLIAAAAYAAAEILAFLDGGTPDTVGAATEISAPARVRRRTWPPHPGCTCLRRRR